jgi:hypothetical protein
MHLNVFRGFPQSLQTNVVTASCHLLLFPDVISSDTKES